MKFSKIINFSICLLLTFTISCFANNDISVSKHSEWMSGEFIAQLKESSSINDLKGLSDYSIETFSSAQNLILLKSIKTKSDSPSNRALDDLSDLSSLQKIEDFNYVEPNFVLRLIKPIQKIRMSDPSLESSTQSSSQWGLGNIFASQAWNLSRGSQNVVVAVVDTGIDPTHYELKNNMWTDRNSSSTIYGYNARSPLQTPFDDNGHGTHVAGVIGANAENNSGIQGINWRVKLMAIKFLSKEGSGSVSDAIKGLEWAVNKGAHILNNSWGGGDYSRSLDETIRWSSSKGVLFVAAAGNESQDLDAKPGYPASYKHSNMVVVGALAQNERLAGFSNYGKGTVHIAAPGSKILSTVPGGKFESWDGTSMAAPHVSGVLALLKSKFPSDSMSSLKAKLLNGVTYNPWIRRQIANEGSSLNAFKALNGNTQPKPVEPPSQGWSPAQAINIASPSPYPLSYEESWQIKHPGAKFIKIFFKQFEVEKNYDFLRIYDGNGTLIDVMTGSHYSGIWSAVIPGESATLTLTTDKMISKKGFIASAYVISTNP